MAVLRIWYPAQAGYRGKYRRRRCSGDHRPANLLVRYLAGIPVPVYSLPRLLSVNANPAYDTEFDENYAAPGSVLQDPTLPAGNLIMLYEAENHCPGGVNQQPYYATVGFARSSDNGKTWPSPQNGVSGNPDRHLRSAEFRSANSTTAHPPMGNAIPSAFVDNSPARSSGDYYVYVTYSYYSTTSSAGSEIRIARAQLGSDSLTFMKWYNGAFSQPGIGGADTAPLPSGGCSGGSETDSEITWNDDLGVYVMIYACVTGPTGSKVGLYYSTAHESGACGLDCAAGDRQFRLWLRLPAPG